MKVSLFGLRRDKTMNKKAEILNAVRDIVFDFLITKREMDRDVPFHFIDDAILGGEITLDEIANAFKKNICYMIGLEDEAELSKRRELTTAE